MNFIMDNLIAAKSAKPMIVVMDNGMVAARRGTGPDAGAGARQAPRGNEAFEDVVIGDLIPMIDATYRTPPDRDNRAIAGVSVGGGQALQIGFLFNYTFLRHDIQEVIVPELAAVPQDLRARWLAHPNAYFFRLRRQFRLARRIGGISLGHCTDYRAKPPLNRVSVLKLTVAG